MEQVVYPIKTVSPQLPLNYDEAKAFFEDGLIYQTRKVFKKELTNIFIFSDGLIYNNLSLLPESSIYLHKEWIERHPPKYFPIRILKDLVKGRIRILPSKEKYLSLFDKWSSNHYHFHVDVLPRLLFLDKSEISQLILILPDTDYFRKSIQGILNLFNFSFKGILFIKPNKRMFVKKCLFISKTADPGTSHPDLILELKKRLNTTKVEKINTPKRIYITRKNAHFRILLNEEEVERVLVKEYDFKAIDFADFSIQEQAHLAANAEVIIGMHGAGLTNLFHMPKGADILEFRRDGIHHNHCYWHLASALGINYSIVLGIPDDNSKVLEGPGCNLFIDIKNLKRVVAKVLTKREDNNKGDSKSSKAS